MADHILALVAPPMAAAPGAKTAPGAVQEGGFTFQYTPSTGPARAVVLLLGWTGCEDKYLAKYSAVHAELGIASLRTTASTWFVQARWVRCHACVLTSTFTCAQGHLHGLETTV